MALAVASSETSGFEDNWQSGKSLAECNLHMLTSEDSCDVSFRVGENEKIVRAHRYILISRSCVFHAMLCGPLAEKEDIKIPDVEENIFSEMLRFLYTNDSTLTPDNVKGLLYLSKKYALGGLERLCLAFLDVSLRPDNACVILEQAHVFGGKDLYDKAFKVILQNGEVSINNQGFNDLCHGCVDKLVKSKDLQAKANTVFTAVLSWTKAECKRQRDDATPENRRRVLGKTLFEIPFTQMVSEDFANGVVPTGILSDEECIKLFCYFSVSTVNVAPFTVKAKQPSTSTDVTTKKYHEASLYAHVSFGSMKLTSILMLKPTNDIRLRGFKAYGSGPQHNYTYTVKIENTQWDLQEMQDTVIYGIPNDQDEVQIYLPESCLLRAYTEYRLSVGTVRGESKCYGVNLTSKVNVGTCQISVSYSYRDKDKRGLVSKLILEEI